MIGWNGDDHALAADRAVELGGKEIAYLAAAFADQADNDHVRVGARDHLTHQHRLADARPGDDGNTLADTGGEERVYGTNAHIERLRHASAIERIALTPGERPMLVGCDRAAPVERLARCIDHATEQGFTNARDASAAVGLDPRATAVAALLVECHEKCAIAPEADNLGAGGVAVRVNHACAGTDRQPEAGGFEHKSVIGGEPTDIARSDRSQIEFAEHGGGLGGQHAHRISSSRTARPI